MNIKKSALAGLAVLYFIAAAFLYWELDVIRASTGEVTFADLDLYAFFYPLMDYGVSSGSIPLWNPYQSLGDPFIGSSLTGIFYPLNFAYYILPVHLALGYTAILHIALAGLFTYAFLHRALGVSRLNSVIGSSIYMFSTPQLIPSFLNAMTWLPLALFLVEMLFREKKNIWGVFIGVVIALQVLTTAIQQVAFTLYTIAGYSLFHLGMGYYREKRILLSPVLYLSAGIITAVLLSSIQWLSTMEISDLSMRSREGLSINEAEPLAELFTPLNIIKSFVLPGPG